MGRSVPKWQARLVLPSHVNKYLQHICFVITINTLNMMNDIYQNKVHYRYISNWMPYKLILPVFFSQIMWYDLFGPRLVKGHEATWNTMFSFLLVVIVTILLKLSKLMYYQCMGMCFLAWQCFLTMCNALLCIK